MKQRVTTSVYWYNDLKDYVNCFDEYYFTEKHFGEMVEYTVEDIEEFNKISKQKGWIE